MMGQKLEQSPVERRDQMIAAPVQALKLPPEAMRAAIMQCITEDEENHGAPLCDRSRERIGLFICAYDAAMSKLAELSVPREP